MEVVSIIIYIVFGVLSITLFFKVWAMTNNVKEIRNLLEEKAKKEVPKAMRVNNSIGDQVVTKSNNSSSKFSVGDQVVSKSYNGTLEIVGINEDGSYICIDVNTDEIVDFFKENELTKKK